MSVNSVQTDYRRSSNPFVAGQIATGKEVHIDTGRLTRGTNGTQYGNLPFGYAVGWVDGPADTGALTGASVQNPFLLKGHVCAMHFTTSGSGATLSVTNFGGVAIRNVALPGAGTQVQGAPDTVGQRVVDAYNLNDLVSIGAEGDFVVVCDGQATIRSGARVNLSTSSNKSVDYGKFSSTAAGNAGSGNDATIHASVPGAIFMTDSTLVTPYNGTSTDAVHLAVVRIRLQPR